MTKLLIHSNAPFVPTGYGSQLKTFGPRLRDHYELAISCFYGLQGGRLIWEEIPLLPGIGETFGNEFLAEHAKRWFGGDHRGGLVFTLVDSWVINPKVAGRLNMICWTPVDHEPLPPLVAAFFRESAAIPVAMSKFGQEQLAEFDPLYVPHAVDCEVFHPYDRSEVRAKAGVPEDAFLVAMIAANKGRPSRKNFQQALEAFAEIRRRHDNALLYLHTVMSEDYAQGVDLWPLVEALGLPEGSVWIADQYKMMFDPIHPTDMAKVYSTADVLLNPSMGEGFGIPVIEAAACGVPAIVTDFSAMKEVGGPGWKVDWRPYWSGQKSWQAIPGVHEIVNALEDCYRLSDHDRRALSRKARRHAERYDADRILAEHFLPALAECEERFGTRAPLTVAA